MIRPDIIILLRTKTETVYRYCGGSVSRQGKRQKYRCRKAWLSNCEYQTGSVPASYRLPHNYCDKTRMPRIMLYCRMVFAILHQSAMIIKVFAGKHNRISLPFALYTRCSHPIFPEHNFMLLFFIKETNEKYRRIR